MIILLVVLHMSLKDTGKSLPLYFPEISGNYGYKPGKIRQGAIGAPKYDVSMEQLEFLVSLGFTVPQLSKCLHVSKSTVTRRLR